MNVLLADRLTPEAIDGLRALGLTVTDTPELNVDSLADALEGVDVLVVNETPVTRRAIERATQLLLIIITSPKQGHVDL